ncbi:MULTISPECIES: tyrosine-type recombinase/integrase [Antarcticibacterium]|uniref:tyrosine-type recombinase/integrase n=1 Tax=Antarcticibacterium TaxID=2058174 RepID=UPI00143DE1BA|nr:MULTISPECIES: tyrosine-type recombinase/integrase [Antarcticibacterium]
MQIENYYNPPEKKNDIPTNLVDYIDFYIDYRKHELKPTSITKYNVIKHKLQRMEERRKKPVLIKEVNESFKREMVEYYKSEQYSINTTQRELGFIKTFCKHARSLDLETHPHLDNLKLEKENVEKVYLSFDELQKIEDVKGLSEHLDNARDWLIISCYTGQRISDFLRFNETMVRKEDYKYLIEFTQKKTGKIMTVPLHDKVLEILGKREGKFPRPISDQRYNDYIKMVCKEAKLNKLTKGSIQAETEPESGKYRKENGTFKKWQLVTSHIGRRSFATNFYGKIPTTYLIYITGHSTETMFLNYIGKSNKDLAMEISKYF